MTLRPRYLMKLVFSIYFDKRIPECHFYFALSLLLCVFLLIFIDKPAKERRAPKLMELVIFNTMPT